MNDDFHSGPVAERTPAAPRSKRACTVAGSEQKAAAVGDLIQFGQAFNVDYLTIAGMVKDPRLRTVRCGFMYRRGLPFRQSNVAAAICFGVASSASGEELG